MSTSTSTNTTGKTRTGAAATTTGSTVRPGLRTGEHVVAVQFAAWGPQEVTVRPAAAAAAGGALRGGPGRHPPDLRLRPGRRRLAYDRLAGRRAGQPRRAPVGVRSRQRHAPSRGGGPERAVQRQRRAASRRHQPHRSGRAPGDHRHRRRGHGRCAHHPALRSYLAAWRKAATVTGMLEDTRDAQ